MLVWFCGKVHMTFVIIAFYILMFPVSANNQSAICDSNKSSAPHSVDKMTSLHAENHNVVGDIGKAKEADLCQPLQRNFSSMNDKMKDFINFIDFRARGKWGVGSKKTEESKVIVDLDEDKVDVLSEVPKEAAFFTKRLFQEGIVVDIPKSSFRKKRLNPLKKSKKKKVLSELRLFYKTSTPRFTYSQRQFTSTKIWNKMFKAVLYPFKKMRMEKKHGIHKPKDEKRSSDYLKLGILGDQNYPNIFQASYNTHQCTYYNTMGYVKKSKKIPTTSLIVPSEKRFQKSTINSIQTFKKNPEISEAALFQIINKLIQDSRENKTIHNLEINIPTERSLFNMTEAIEDNHRKNRKKGTLSSHSKKTSNFNLAIIIAKITDEPEYSSTATLLTIPNSVSTSQKYRNDERSTSASTFAKKYETTTSKPVSEFEKKSREKYQRNNTQTMSSNDFNTHKCKVDKTHNSKLAKQASKEGLSSLLKEIIRHVSIALDSVTTSREFIELISCNNMSSKSISDGDTDSESAKYNQVSTMNKKYPLVQCSEADKSNWLKTKDNCINTEVTCCGPKMSRTQLNKYSTEGISSLDSSMEVTDDCLKYNSGSDSTKNQGTEIECDNILTTTQCTVFLDDEEEYYESLNMTGNSPFLIPPEDASVVEDYQTASYIKSYIASSLKRKRNRKNNVAIGTEDLGDSSLYEAKELIKQLERYHTMLKDPIVTKIWDFFQVTTRASTEISRSSYFNKLKKRKSNLNMRIHKSIQRDHNLKSRKRKVNFITENVLDKLSISNVNGFETKKQSAEIFRIGDPRNMGVQEPVMIKEKKNSESAELLTCANEMPSAWNSKFRKLFRESGVYSSPDRDDKNSVVRSVYNQDVTHKFDWPADKIRSGGLAEAMSHLHAFPGTTSYYLDDLPSIRFSRG